MTRSSFVERIRPNPSLVTGQLSSRTGELNLLIDCAEYVSAPNVEPIKHHDFVPNLHEIFHEPGMPIAACIHLGNGTQLTVRAKDEIASRRLETRFPRCAVIERKHHALFVLLLPFVIHAGQDGEEVVSKDADPIGENSVCRPVVVRTHCPQPSDQRYPFGSRECEQLSLVEEHFLRRDTRRHFRKLIADVIAEAVYHWLQPIEHLDVGQFLRRISAARRERNRNLNAGIQCCPLERHAAPEHDEVCERNPYVAGLFAVKILCYAPESRDNGYGSPVDRPIFLRGKRKSPPVRAAALVTVAVGGGRRIGSEH